MKQYKVLKPFINASVGEILSADNPRGDLYKLPYYSAGDNTVVSGLFVCDAIQQGFIEEYKEEPKRWNTNGKYGSTYYYLSCYCDINPSVDNDKMIYDLGNYFKSEDTAELVSEAMKLFYEYLHTIPGTPQQNIKNQFEHAHNEARKAVLKDDEAQ